MSVGLLAVQMLYRPYVCVHLSKWFTFSQFLVGCLMMSCLSLRLLVIGSGKGISPLPSHGTGREPLDSSGSSCSESLD
jgi:hypothetical protein